MGGSLSQLPLTKNKDSNSNTAHTHRKSLSPKPLIRESANSNLSDSTTQSGESSHRSSSVGGISETSAPFKFQPRPRSAEPRPRLSRKKSSNEKTQNRGSKNSVGSSVHALGVSNSYGDPESNTDFRTRVDLNEGLIYKIRAELFREIAAHSPSGTVDSHDLALRLDNQLIKDVVEELLESHQPIEEAVPRLLHILKERNSAELLKQHLTGVLHVQNPKYHDNRIIAIHALSILHFAEAYGQEQAIALALVQIETAFKAGTKTVDLLVDFSELEENYGQTCGPDVVLKLVTELAGYRGFCKRVFFIDFPDTCRRHCANWKTQLPRQFRRRIWCVTLENLPHVLPDYVARSRHWRLPQDHNALSGTPPSQRESTSTTAGTIDSEIAMFLVDKKMQTFVETSNRILVFIQLENTNIYQATFTVRSINKSTFLVCRFIPSRRMYTVSPSSTFLLSYPAVQDVTIHTTNQLPVKGDKIRLQIYVLHPEHGKQIPTGEDADEIRMLIDRFKHNVLMKGDSELIVSQIFVRECDSRGQEREESAEGLFETSSFKSEWESDNDTSVVAFLSQTSMGPDVTPREVKIQPERSFTESEPSKEAPVINQLSGHSEGVPKTSPRKSLQDSKHLSPAKTKLPNLDEPSDTSRPITEQIAGKVETMLKQLSQEERPNSGLIIKPYVRQGEQSGIFAIKNLDKKVSMSEITRTTANIHKRGGERFHSDSAPDDIRRSNHHLNKNYSGELETEESTYKMDNVKDKSIHHIPLPCSISERTLEQKKTMSRSELTQTDHHETPLQETHTETELKRFVSGMIQQTVNKFRDIVFGETHDVKEQLEDFHPQTGLDVSKQRSKTKLNDKISSVFSQAPSPVFLTEVRANSNSLELLFPPSINEHLVRIIHSQTNANGFHGTTETSPNSEITLTRPNDNVSMGFFQSDGNPSVQPAYAPLLASTHKGHEAQSPLGPVTINPSALNTVDPKPQGQTIVESYQIKLDIQLCETTHVDAQVKNDSYASLPTPPVTDATEPPVTVRNDSCRSNFVPAIIRQLEQKRTRVSTRKMVRAFPQHGCRSSSTDSTGEITDQPPPPHRKTSNTSVLPGKSKEDLHPRQVHEVRNEFGGPVTDHAYGSLKASNRTLLNSKIPSNFREHLRVALGELNQPAEIMNSNPVSVGSNETPADSPVASKHIINEQQSKELSSLNKDPPPPIFPVKSKASTATVGTLSNNNSHDTMTLSDQGTCNLLTPRKVMHHTDSFMELGPDQTGLGCEARTAEHAISTSCLDISKLNVRIEERLVHAGNETSVTHHLSVARVSEQHAPLSDQVHNFQGQERQRRVSFWSRSIIKFHRIAGNSVTKSILKKFLGLSAIVTLILCGYSLGNRLIPDIAMMTMPVSSKLISSVIAPPEQHWNFTEMLGLRPAYRGLTQTTPILGFTKHWLQLLLFGMTECEGCWKKPRAGNPRALQQVIAKQKQTRNRRYCEGQRLEISHFIACRLVEYFEK